MANTLRFKRGLVATIPTAAAGEPLFTTDTFDLYIGNGTGNTRFQKYIASGTTSQLLRGDGSLLTMPIVLTSPSSGQVLKYNGTSWVNDSDAGITGSGTTNYLPKFTGASTLGNSLVYDNGTNVGIGTTSPTNFTSFGYGAMLEILGGRGGGFISTSSGSTHKMIMSVDSNASLGTLKTLTSTGLMFATNDTERARITATGNFIINNTSDNGLRFQVTGDGSFSGGVGINGSTIVNEGLSVQYNLAKTNTSTATVSRWHSNEAAGSQFKLNLFAQGSATGSARAFMFQTSNEGVANDGVLALQPFGGNVGIGTTSLTGVSLSVSKNITGAVASIGIVQAGQVQTDVTSVATGFRNVLNTAASTPLGDYYHIRLGQGTIGAGTTLTQQIGLYINDFANGTSRYGILSELSAGTGKWNLYMGGTAANYLNGNTLIGSTTDTGEKLQVNGTMKVTGASTFGGAMTMTVNQNSGTISTVRNTTAGTSSEAYFQATSDTSSGSSTFGKTSSLFSGYKILTASSGYLFNGTAGNLAILNDFASGSIVMAAGASSTAHFTIASTGAATFSSSVTATRYLVTPSGSSTVYNFVNSDSTYTGAYAFQAGGGSSGYGGAIMAYGHSHATKPGWITAGISAGSGGKFSVNTQALGGGTDVFTVDTTGAGVFNSSIQAATAIAIGTTPDTNKPFKILKNINDTVGIRFENTSTGSLAFSAIQMGTDVTGGTKFTNLVYASSGVTANGVYQPDGTSLINNGSGGLNFLGNPIRMYTGGSNGTLRWDMTNDGFITQYTGTNPTTNATDGYRQYSADVVAGNAAPHFRTENGAIIKLYQETTGVGNSIISLGGGNAVLDDTTFDGYTLRQIVKALRNQGILQ